MAAPTKTNRATPVGYPMPEGWKSLVTMSADTAILLWEKEVTFAGRDGGDPIPTSNMLTGTWETDRPRGLKRMSDLTMTCAYSGGTFSSIDVLVNKEQTFTQIFPGSTGYWCAFFGWIRSVTPQNNQIGNQPLVQIVIHPSQWDYTNNVEAGPAYGTGAVLS